MAISGGEAIFINGHDVSSIEKTGANIVELLLKAIDYVALLYLFKNFSALELLKAKTTRDDYEDFKNWDAYPEDANIEEDFTTIKQRDNVSLSDSEEDGENNFDDVSVPSLALNVTASPSCPPLIIQKSSSMEKIERAQRRLEKERGKKQKK
ncbi:hypothetical protein ACSBR1_007981 [Camellia fascicularis]